MALTIVSLLMFQHSFAQVQQDWAQALYFPNNGYDEPGAILTDPSGNVFVTGSGRPGPSADLIVAKYNPSGVLQWMSTYNGSGNSTDGGMCLARDASGNIYVGGTIYTADSARSVCTAKYNSAGVLQWLVRWDKYGTESVSGAEYAKDIAIDGAGNIYVFCLCQAGNSFGTEPAASVVLKYNAAGVLLWSQAYQYNSSDRVYAIDMKLDPSGNPVIAIASNTDMVIIKYTPSGIISWLRTFGAFGTYEFPVDMAIDGTGNVFVAGGTGSNIILQKYSPTGALSLSTLYVNPYNKDDRAIGIALDGTGNVLIGGKSINGSNNQDFLVLKYSPAFALLWAARYSETSTSYEDVFAMTTDNSGNTYLSGTTTGNGILTAKFSTSGSLAWNIRYTNSSSYCRPSDMVTFTKSSPFQLPTTVLYVLGFVNASSYNNDVLTIKYSQPSVNAITLLSKDPSIPVKPVIPARETYSPLLEPEPVFVRILKSSSGFRPAYCGSVYC